MWENIKINQRKTEKKIIVRHNPWTPLLTSRTQCNLLIPVPHVLQCSFFLDFFQFLFLSAQAWVHEAKFSRKWLSTLQSILEYFSQKWHLSLAVLNTSSQLFVSKSCDQGKRKQNRTQKPQKTPKQTLDCPAILYQKFSSFETVCHCLASLTAGVLMETFLLSLGNYFLIKPD